MNERIGDDQFNVRIEGPGSDCDYPLLRNNIQKELLRLPKHFVVAFHSRCCLALNGTLL